MSAVLSSPGESHPVLGRPSGSPNPDGLNPNLARYREVKDLIDRACDRGDVHGARGLSEEARRLARDLSLSDLRGPAPMGPELAGAAFACSRPRSSDASSSRFLPEAKGTAGSSESDPASILHAGASDDRPFARDAGLPRPTESGRRARVESYREQLADWRQEAARGELDVEGWDR